METTSSLFKLVSKPKNKYDGILKTTSAEEMPHELIDLMDKHKVKETFAGILKQSLDTREAQLMEKFCDEPKII